MSRWESWRRRIALVVVSMMMALTAAPSAAWACTQDSDCVVGTCNNAGNCINATTQDVALGVAVTGSVFAGVGVLVTPFLLPRGTSSPGASKSVWQIFLFSSGGIDVLFGGIALAMQSSLRAPCPVGSECEVTWIVGGTTAGIGVLEALAGVIVSATPARAFPRASLDTWYASLRPKPLVIPTAKGAAVGLSISGVTF